MFKISKLVNLKIAGAGQCYKLQKHIVSVISYKNISFIENQPENPWSLDRGMNGVMSQVHIFLLKILYFSKIHTIIYIQENPFPSL